jgi:hypothetical protein
MEEILNILAWAEHPLLECAGSKVIMAEEFSPTATQIADLSIVDKTAKEINDIFLMQSKRFSACGANNSEKYGVLRKNPQIGWNYIVELILKDNA